MELVTPEIIAAILKSANPVYRHGHELNQHHGLVSRCKIGAVFVNQEGDYCVYTGIFGNNRARPVMFTRVRDRAPMKAPIAYLRKIIAASES